MKGYTHVTIASVFILVFAMAFMPIGAAESQVAPYRTNLNGDGGWGYTNDPYLETITHFHSYRIRSSDDITKAMMYAIELDSFDEFYITIWRENTATPGTFDKITQTENLKSKFHEDGGINTLVFDTPLTGIKEGDFYGMCVHHVMTFTPFVRLAEPDMGDGYYSTYFRDGTTPATFQPVGTLGYAWRTQSHSRNAQPIALFTAKNTDFIFVGNSITEGYYRGDHDLSQRAYWTDVYNTPNGLDNYGWAPNAKFEVLSGLSTQNMANFSAESDDILARFDQVLAMNPENIVLAVGVNDVRHNPGVTEQDSIDNQIAMINTAMSAGIQVYYVDIFAYGKVGDSTDIPRHQEIDRINAAVAAHATSVGAYVVNTDSRIACYHPGGDPGNLWAIEDEDTSDGLHMSAVGNDEFAAAVYEVYLANQPTPPVVGVFDGAFSNLNDVTGDAWAMMGLLPIVLIAGGVLTIVVLMFAGQAVDPKLIMAIIPVIIIIITAMYVGIMIIDALPK